MKLLIVLTLVVAYTTAMNLPREKIHINQPVFQHDGRIAGGENADIRKFNYQVGLEPIGLDQYGYLFYFCGGSLLAHNWVLTAAHCTEGFDRINVYLGSSKRAQAQVKFLIIRSTNNIIEHELYDSDNVINDIALIRIPTVEYRESIQPVNLPKVGSDGVLNDKYATVSGWGYLGDGASSNAPFLQSVTLRIISNAECTKTFNDITDGNICVATADGSIMRSPCKGDSGSPLVLLGTNIQIGVASYIHDDGCEAGRPAVFTRVSYYVDWILKKTGITV